MRRKNRQVTDWKEIKEIVGRCKVARLGMNDDGKVYVVPNPSGYFDLARYSFALS